MLVEVTEKQILDFLVDDPDFSDEEDVGHSRAPISRNSNDHRAGAKFSDYLLKEINTIVEDHPDDLKPIPNENLAADLNDPIKLGERIVFRTGVDVPVDIFVRLHELITTATKNANTAAAMMIGKFCGEAHDETSDDRILIRSAIQELYKELDMSSLINFGSG